MDIGTVRGLVTLVLLLAFLGLCVWAWSAKRKADFDAAARLPLADESPPPARDQSDRREEAGR